MENDKKVVFFDGQCVLCNNSVKFLLQKDRKKELYFATLTSDYAKSILQPAINWTPSSVVFLSKGKIYTNSKAVLKLCAHLGFPYNLLQINYLVPKFIRDAVYQFIAKNRLKWFGKQEYCLLPTAETRRRFLN